MYQLSYFPISKRYSEPQFVNHLADFSNRHRLKQPQFVYLVHPNSKVVGNRVPTFGKHKRSILKNMKLKISAYKKRFAY